MAAWRRPHFITALRGHRSTSESGTLRDFEASLWRALAVFRLAALIYALVLIFHSDPGYQHRIAAWVVGAVITVWTVVVNSLYAKPRWRRWPLLTADMAVMGACLLVSAPIFGVASLGHAHSLTGPTVAGPVVACAIVGGPVGGLIASLVIAAIDLSIRGLINQSSLNSLIILLLTAFAIGYVSRLSVTSHIRLARAVELEAASRTRERLARDIHDSVLQVLALVARRAHALGGEAAELGRLAGEQEVALRALIATADRPLVAAAGDGRADLRPTLERFASATVTVVAPGTEINLPAHACEELAAAVSSALENVAQHAGSGARTWILLEDDVEAVTVTVRDDGTGIPPGRLEAAEADGRLGVAQSIRGRLRDLGGTTLITSSAGMGTEVELRLPRIAI